MLSEEEGPWGVGVGDSGHAMLPKFGVSLVPNLHLPMLGVPTTTHPFVPEQVHVLHVASIRRLAWGCQPGRCE